MSFDSYRSIIWLPLEYNWAPLVGLFDPQCVAFSHKLCMCHMLGGGGVGATAHGGQVMCAPKVGFVCLLIYCWGVVPQVGRVCCNLWQSITICINDTLIYTSVEDSISFPARWLSYQYPTITPASAYWLSFSISRVWIYTFSGGITLISELRIGHYLY